MDDPRIELIARATFEANNDPRYIKWEYDKLHRDWHLRNAQIAIETLIDKGHLVPPGLTLG